MTMKTIGILGGMSCESTALYYARLNAGTRARLGGLHSADCLIRSLDFAEVEALQTAGDWDGAGAMLADAAKALEAGGAELLILATNTMHKVAGPIESAISIPFVHIADATAAALHAAGCKRPGLMATAYTMEQAFYLWRLRAAGLNPIVPGTADRAETHRIIYEELCRGDIHDASRAAYVAIAGRLRDAGADGLILGCTEVGMLLSAANSPLPVFDTTLIHCDAALDAAMA
jgi:aspartate racemase